MRSSGFTLLEILLSTALAAVVVVGSSAWLAALERTSQRAYREEMAFRSAVLVATRLREDLASTVELPMDGAESFELQVDGPDGGVRRVVSWRRDEGRVLRSVGVRTQGSTSVEVIAAGIDVMACRDEGRGFRVIHVVAGNQVVDLPVHTRGARAP